MKQLVQEKTGLNAQVSLKYMMNLTNQMTEIVITNILA